MDHSHLEPLSQIYALNKPQMEMISYFAIGNKISIKDPFCNGIKRQMEIYEEINNYVIEIIKQIK